MLQLETDQPQPGSFKSKVAVAVAATAAIGVVAAITFSSTSSVARQTTGLFNIPEDIKGHFSGGQITGEWTVQGKFHKFETASGDWQIDSKLTVEGPTMGGVTETYTLVDNVLVMVSDSEAAKMQCGERENLPAYVNWAKHLDNAAVIQESDMSDGFKQSVKENCPTGSTAVGVNVDDRPYIICADSTANTRAMYAFNRDFSFSAVSREGMTVEIEHPEGWEALNCTTFDATKTREQAAALGRISDYDDDEDRELQWGGNGGQFNWNNFDFSGITLGGGNIERRSCAFFHGAGGLARPHRGLEKHITEYWAPVGSEAELARHDGGFETISVGGPCDNKNKYIDTDTCKRGYDDMDLMKELCKTLEDPDFQDQTKSVIFTHSMGGLATRRAFADNVCSWEGAYYQSQAPMAGSNASTFAKHVCKFLTIIVVGYLAIWTAMSSFCKPAGFDYHNALRSIERGKPTYGKTGKTADGRLCGTQPWGSGGGMGILFNAISKYGKLQRRRDWCMFRIPSCSWRGCSKGPCQLWYTCPYNDGSVSWDSCAQLHKHGDTNVQRMGINHADGTGRNGDRASGKAFIKDWFHDRIDISSTRADIIKNAKGECWDCLTPKT